MRIKILQSSILALFLVFFLVVPSNAASVLPKSQGFVNDFANVLSAQTKQELEQTLATFAKEKSHEVSVVTIKTLEEEPIEDYANRLFREWGIGKKEYNNGVLFLIAVDDHKMRIEVGYGLEGALTDLASKHIQDDIVRPLFQAGKYDDGVRNGTEAIMKTIEGEVVASSPVSPAPTSWLNFLERYGGETLFFLIFFLSWFASILGRTKSWWLGGVIGGVAGGIVAIITSAWLWLPIVVVFGLLFDFIVSKNYKQNVGGRPAWWAGGGWGGWDNWGGGSGGGFGGFGGGSSGGGGSSSGW